MQKEYSHMVVSTPAHLLPRKRPLQARSSATIDAIFEASLQLLIAHGPARLTTTRVAERAGVSIGTIYQYFPHKKALLYALNERYLDDLAARIVETCRLHEGATRDIMVAALVHCYWEAKTERADVTRVLYQSVTELDNGALIETFAARVDVATTAMLASAPDAQFANIKSVNLALVTVIFGAVRNAFERNLVPEDNIALKDQLVLMCQAYLSAAKEPPR